MGPLVHVFAFVLLLTNIHARYQDSTSKLLSLLHPKSSNSQSPVIVIIDTRDHLSLGGDSDESQESGDLKGDDEAPSDQEAYELYNVLRSQSEDDLSSGEAGKLRETKQVLRAALRARCQKLDKCAKKCPKPKKITCVMTCQEKFDKDNACKEPEEEPECGKKKDKCNKPKRGRTMPPYWLFY